MQAVSGLDYRTISRVLQRSPDLFETKATVAKGAKFWGLTSRGREIVGRIRRNLEAAA